ncbi:hypothetical protein SDC9_97435 [bioreactor metagenome]|uniref:Uncharacterized protein n=1 Tax=bioreactor metagenome TaxID=1076179 RepID=A0A645ABX3_9ZZZZ
MIGLLSKLLERDDFDHKLELVGSHHRMGELKRGAADQRGRFGPAAYRPLLQSDEVCILTVVLTDGEDDGAGIGFLQEGLAHVRVDGEVVIQGLLQEPAAVLPLDVGPRDGDGIAVDDAQALDEDHLGEFGNPKLLRHAEVGVHRPELEDLGGVGDRLVGRDAAKEGIGGAQVLYEFLGGDEGALALLAMDVRLVLEDLQCCDDGGPAHLVQVAEFCFGGDGVAGFQLIVLNHFLDFLSNLVLEGDGPTGHISSSNK